MTISTPAIPYRLTRSWLLAPAVDDERIRAAHNSDADVVIIDIEDGVPERKKEHSRLVTRRWLEADNGWVRINDATSAHWNEDVSALKHSRGLAGIILAKTESPEQVARTAAELGGNVPIVALIESAAGIDAARSIASEQSVVRLAFGTGDFRRDTGMSDTPTALAFPRSQLVIASRVAGIAAPIDGPTLGENSADVVAGVGAATEMGMTGKLCLAESHAATINAALSPGRDEISWALAIIERLGSDGRNVGDGSDLPRLARAQRIVERSRAFDAVR